MPLPDTDQLPDWVLWMAQDADGTWWGYEAEPHQYDHGWYENEVGRIIRVRKTLIDSDWKCSLTNIRDR